MDILAQVSATLIHSVESLYFLRIYRREIFGGVPARLFFAMIFALKFPAPKARMREGQLKQRGSPLTRFTLRIPSYVLQRSVFGPI